MRKEMETQRYHIDHLTSQSPFIPSDRGNIVPYNGIG